MARIYHDMTELIGNTPLVSFHHLTQVKGVQAEIVAKVESFNPGGSVKDRAALNMITDAEKKGTLPPGGTIIEPTSGNTGVGLAWIGRLKGYQTLIVMPDSMSIERQRLLKAAGATLILTPGALGMSGAIAEAERLQAKIEGSVILGQFDNPANTQAHILTTGEEIWRDTDGDIAAFVAGVGSGGTLSGCGKVLKMYSPAVKIVAVEPDASPVLSGGKAAPHGIQGIGANFIPKNYDADVVDEIIRITDDEALRTGRELSQYEGLLAGISSGAAVCAALKLAGRPEYKGTRIVTLLPDTGERYLSTKLFDSEHYPL